MLHNVCHRALAFAALGTLAATPAVQAAEPFAIYDRFDGPSLDPSRWIETERTRQVRNGGLHLMQRTPVFSISDAGLTFSNWNANMPAALPVTSIRARIRVDALEAASCPSNPSPGQSRARIIGSFFNVGIPEIGSQVGDVIAQVRITRFSNAADPAGVLRVQGIASQCASVDCASAATIGNIVDLGTVTIGTAATVQLQWDQAAKTFTFSRDGGAFSGTVGYSLPDTTPPSSVFHQVSTRLDLPNCTTASASGMVEARFDNIAVNRSAVPN